MEQMQEMVKIAKKIDKDNGIESMGYKAVSLEELNQMKLNPITDLVMVLDKSMNGAYGETMAGTSRNWVGGNVIDGWINPAPKDVDSRRGQMGYSKLTIQEQYLTGGVALNHEANIHGYRTIINSLTDGYIGISGDIGSLHHGDDGGLGGTASSIGYSSYTKIEKYTEQDIKAINLRNSTLINFNAYNEKTDYIKASLKKGDLKWDYL